MRLTFGRLSRHVLPTIIAVALALVVLDFGVAGEAQGARRSALLAEVSILAHPAAYGTVSQPEYTETPIVFALDPGDFRGRVSFRLNVVGKLDPGGYHCFRLGVARANAPVQEVPGSEICAEGAGAARFISLHSRGMEFPVGEHVYMLQHKGNDRPFMLGSARILVEDAPGRGD